MKTDNIAKEYIMKIYRNEEYLKLIKEGKLPLSFESLDDEFIKKWNSTNVIDYNFFNEKIRIEYGDEVSDLIEIKDEFNEIIWKFNESLNEYEYFKKESKTTIDKLLDQYKKLLKEDEIKNDERIESWRMNDISTGIFSVNEANSRAIFNSISNRTYSDETISTGNALHHHLKISISFIYLKLEELYDIGFNLVNKKNEDKKLYLWNKNEGMIDNLPGWKNFYEKNNHNEISLKINDFANKYKHQKNFNSENTLYDDYEIMIQYIDSVFDFMKQKIGNNLFVFKVEEMIEEIEEVCNPLGLTGFEIE